MQHVIKCFILVRKKGGHIDVTRRKILWQECRKNSRE